MNDKLLSKLTKRDILSLPGFTNRKASLSELRTQLNNRLTTMNINKRGARTIDYINAFKHADNELFNKLSHDKINKQQHKQQRKQYKQSIKESALNERSLFNLPTDLYTTTKTEARKQYEKRIKEVSDKSNFQKYMKEFMNNVNNRFSFEIVIGDDEDKRLAFCETLRQCYKLSSRDRPVVKAHSIDDTHKYFTLSDKHEIDFTIGHIAGTIELTTYSSDDDPSYTGTFIPIRYELLFINRDKVNKKTKFTVNKHDAETNKIYKEEIEIDEDFRERPNGSFFPYINLSNIDLTDFQIFNSVNKTNYKDNCFVYACIKSGVFDETEINNLRYIVKTRSVPSDKIYEVAKIFNCHFVVKRIYEKDNITQQIKIDTRKKPWAKNFDRIVELLLFKNHYMLYKNIPTTTFYLTNHEELDSKFSTIPIETRKLICGLDRGRYPKYAKNGTSPMIIFRKMFDLGLFREIKLCELNILSTTEFTNNINDYDDLDYDENTCCKIVKNEALKDKFWTKIYYSDFETNVNVSPHKPYLNCTVWRTYEKINCVSFTGDNIADELLNFLDNGSLTYFHNLQYDGCFFLNAPGWKTKILKRESTILQIEMRRPIRKREVKTLTFRDSYSIIQAPLRSFANMFNLNVHKEVMAYKLYTEHNINRGMVSALEFQLQYYAENKDNKPLKNITNDWKQLIENAKIANAYSNLKIEEHSSATPCIDIMQYAKFYCKKDCIVLMKGMEKFNSDLIEVFEKTKTKMGSVHNFISISSIGYQFAKMYGCFDRCYELSGKPQNFIQRCVSGGRTMTANNEKQYIEGRIQDFDAVSLYPSAMSVMDGVPKGKPKIIPANATTEDLLRYDTFFAEINITNIKCKSDYEYKFGQVFIKNENGSKIFNNKPVNNFYIDKVAFKDLMEFYEFDYELIRGYYFNEGFNNKINSFITKLFNLRLKYKKEKNPLQSTIKLLLNSIYGKSILKAMPTETKCISKDKIYKYILRNYNFITEATENDSINNVYVKIIKPIDNHFNLPQFGASVLSWSKHLMNKVISTAEQNGINIFYQDTDSVHVMEDDVKRIADIFKRKYGQELIGERMTQFHNDFDSFDGAVGNVCSRKLIALGKKSYLDILVDEVGNEGYHIRMKSIPKQCILNKCKRLNITVEELYERLYNGEEIRFNLLDGCNCFRKNKSFQQINLPQFNRTVKFTS
ncbi:hypothetical protein M9Y10_039422 [Tritrichomonas musculus]|uniref:DNA-directed DNA polymerase n=1 Tax=Tritrichomonas musculus TaxID=1915356 RepID=A0ABR2KB93_9EUKA